MEPKETNNSDNKPLSVEDIEIMEAKLSADQLLRFEPLKTSLLMHQSCLDMYKLNSEVTGYLKERDKTNYNFGKSEKQKQIEKSIEDLESKMKAISLQSPKNYLDIKKPCYGNNGTFDFTKIEFLPLLNDGTSNKIQTLWKRLCPIIESLKLTEEAAKLAFSSRLGGARSETFDLYEYEKLELTDIVTRLAKQFDKPETRASYLESLRLFTRQEGETVPQAIQRLRTILTGLNSVNVHGKPMLPEDQIIRNQLIQMVDKNVWTNALKAERSVIISGHTFTIDHLINTCDEEEQTLMDAKEAPLQMRINSITKDESPPPKAPRPQTPFHQDHPSDVEDREVQGPSVDEDLQSGVQYSSTPLRQNYPSEGEEIPCVPDHRIHSFVYEPNYERPPQYYRGSFKPRRSYHRRGPRYQGGPWFPQGTHLVHQRLGISRNPPAAHQVLYDHRSGTPRWDPRRSNPSHQTYEERPDYRYEVEEEDDDNGNENDEYVVDPNCY